MYVKKLYIPTCMGWEGSRLNMNDLYGDDGRGPRRGPRGYIREHISFKMFL